ncbi:MAG: methylated-DNA--[protein]-cysteine S-methyltransferase [Bdellovibrionota bacterium]
MITCFQRTESPVGTLFLAASDDALQFLGFEHSWMRLRNKVSDISESDNPVLTNARRQLEEYFKGERRQFSLPVALHGTAFQMAVWRSLSFVPYGTTRTYSEQAGHLRLPKAVRAVGRANGLNPVCIVLPCHRIVGKSGALTGYAGGLAAKQFLLAHEATFNPRLPDETSSRTLGT